MGKSDNKHPDSILNLCGFQVHLLWANDAPTLEVLEDLPRLKELTYAQSIRSKIRKREHLASRWLIQQLIPDHQVIHRKDDGTPNWPRPWKGSISHKSGHVCVVLCHEKDAIGIGLDIESVTKFNMNIRRKICTKDEELVMSIDRTTDESERRRLLCTIFAAKEALYKAMYPNGKTQFWFEDAAVVDWNKQDRILTMAVLKQVAKHAKAGYKVPCHIKWVSNHEEQYVLALAVDQKNETSS